VVITTKDGGRSILDTASKRKRDEWIGAVTRAVSEAGEAAETAYATTAVPKPAKKSGRFGCSWGDSLYVTLFDNDGDRVMDSGDGMATYAIASVAGGTADVVLEAEELVVDVVEAVEQVVEDVAVALEDVAEDTGLAVLS